MNVYLRGNTYFVDFYRDGKRIRKSTGSSNLAEATEYAKKHAQKSPRRPRGATEITSAEFMYLIKKLGASLLNATYRDKSRGQKSDLTMGDLLDLLASQNCRCAVSGLPFSATKVEGARRRPWMPSLDRIDCTKPYTKENTRIVCTAVNIALNDWGDEVFQAMVCGASHGTPMVTPSRKAALSRILRASYSEYMNKAAKRVGRPMSYVWSVVPTAN